MTGVIEVEEMGTQYRVGGIDELGEVSWKLDFNAVGITNIAMITGQTYLSGSAQTTTVNLTSFQQASVDIIRMVADKTNTIYGTLYVQDAIIEEYGVDVKSNGLVSETVSGKGPNCTYFPGFIVPKTYVVQAGDIVSGVCSITLTSGGGVIGTDEAPVEIYLPGSSQPQSYWQTYGAQYFLKIEQVPGAVLTTNPVRYYEVGHPAAVTATWNNGTHKLTFPSGAITAGDLIRIVYCTYNNDAFPLTVPATSPDTADPAGVHARLVPITINANTTTRIESASIKFSLKRDHVNGVGENSIIYGIPAVPDVAITLDVKESDPALMSLLATGNDYITGTSVSGTIANDFIDLSYPTRWELDPSNALPFLIQLDNPFGTSPSYLMQWSTPQLVVKGIDFGSSNKADNTVKLTALDIIGNLSIAFTHP